MKLKQYRLTRIGEFSVSNRSMVWQSKLWINKEPLPIFFKDNLTSASIFFHHVDFEKVQKMLRRWNGIYYAVYDDSNSNHMTETVFELFN